MRELFGPPLRYAGHEEETAIPAAVLARIGRRRAGDARARFDAVSTPLLGPLFRFAMGMTRNRDDAEDLVQETFVHAYRAFGSFRAGSNFKAWLFRICVNLYVDLYRSRGRAPAMVPLLDSDQDVFETGPATPSPEQVLLDSIMDEELTAALDTLPAAFRAALLLTDVEGLTYDEAATILGVPVGTVRSRLFRGRNQLRASLAGYARRRGLFEEAP